jgi:hypothetical protein
VLAASDVYDSDGKLWKAWVSTFTVRANTPANQQHTDNDEVGAVNGAIMGDMQREHVTTMSIPAAGSANESGRGINMGAKSGVTEVLYRLASHCRRAVNGDVGP